MLVIATCFVLAATTAITGAKLQADERIKILHTPAGVRIGIADARVARPAPTVLVLGTDIERSLQEIYPSLCGNLAKYGYLCVSLDLPCHGSERKPEEPKGLYCWRDRLVRGDNVIHQFIAQATEALEYLTREGYTDARKVAVCGTSRGGFAALHLAAADRRFRAVVAFAPVTDLLSLSEFAGMEKHEATRSLALEYHAEELAGRPIWLCIGHNDRRVDTDAVIRFVRRIARASAAQGESTAGLELHLVDGPPQSLGHTIHVTAHDEAAIWLSKQLERGE